MGRHETNARARELIPSSSRWSRQAYGSIFTLHLAGQKITYATTPELIAAIYKNSKAFVFLPIRAELSTTLFGE